MSSLSPGPKKSGLRTRRWGACFCSDDLIPTSSTLRSLLLRQSAVVKFQYSISSWASGRLSFRFIWVVLNRPILAYCDANQNTMWPVGSEPYGKTCLLAISHPSRTQWSIVYDPKNLSIYFRTLGNQEIRHFDLEPFDLSCSTPVRLLDVQGELSGDISDKFTDYTYQINRNVVGEAFRKTPFLSHLPNGNLDIRVSYPDEITFCTD